MLPREGQAPDRTLPLSRIGLLLPYHQHVAAEAVVRGLNRLLGEVAEGAEPFVRFYPEEEIRRDPAKANTGLFHLRGRPGAPFALVCPGGGFQYVATLHEGLPVAEAIARFGYHAFVLRYRAGQGGAAATADLAAALAWIFRHAGALGVSRQSYSLWGFSAGARMAAASATHGAARFGGEDLPRPAALILAYTGHSETGSAEPATFAVVGSEDGISPPEIMQRRIDALRRSGTEAVLRVFPGVGHGFGLGEGTSAAGWAEEAVRFWDRARQSQKESR